MRNLVKKNISLMFIIISSIAFSQEKTNVLMIVLDDLSDYIGVMGGHPQAKTPNIDKLAKEGVLFNNAHSNVPVCSPSRASFMTGISPVTSGNWGFGNWQKNKISMNSKSLPEYFKDNGYKTYQSGKVFHTPKKGVWDEMGAVPDYGPMAYNGKKAALHPSCPEAMGELGPLDATFASLDDIPNVPKTNEAPGYKGWYNTHWKTKSPFKYEDDNNRDLLTDEKTAEWFQKKIKQLSKQEAKNPFFMALGFIRPHTPLVVPKKYFDMFPLENVQIPITLKNDKDDTKLYNNASKETRGQLAYRTLTSSYSSKEKALQKYTQAYLASIAFADEMVGKVMETLNKSTFNKNTVVVLLSDHGYNLGEKEYLFKYCLWEETTKVPLIIRSPKHKKTAGKKVEHPVSLIDIYPTLQDLCNLKGSTLINENGAELDGFSLKPFLKNPKTTKWNGPDVALTIISSWKSKKPERQHISLRSKDFRYIRYANGEVELYDHRNDANEWYNLEKNSDYSAVKKNFEKKLNNLLTKK